MKKLLLALFTMLPVWAGLREPDAIVWGSVIIDRVAVTAANTGVVVEARRTAGGPAIASYQMGTLAQAGDYYSLRLTVESGLPLSDANAVLAGDVVYLVVKSNGVDKDAKQYTVAGRGTISRLDFGSLDVDNDGLLDDWETRYFGNTSADPNADPDGDGASNLREFLEGTDPTVADARHPADRSPNDGRITINEVTAYGLAWKSNLTWPSGPTNPIPVSYVTRAGALWKGGEAYKLDTNVAVTAPLWWTNVPLAALEEPKKSINKDKEKDTSSKIQRQLSVTSAGVSAGFAIGLQVDPVSTVFAYAVEEKVPAGWTAQEISDGGSLSSDHKTIRWGVYFDATPRAFSYRLTSTASATGPVKFDGVASFDGLDIATTGVVNLADPSGALVLNIGKNADVGVRGLPGQTVTLEVSTDLATWTQAGQTTIATDGTARINGIVTNSAAFYRARTQ